MLISSVFIVLCQVLLSIDLANGVSLERKIATHKTGATSQPIGISSSPTHIILDYGDFKGKSDAGIESWSGIPYADPPIGAKRFAPAVAPTNKFFNFDASKPALGCTLPDPTAGVNLNQLNMTVVSALQSLPKGLVPSSASPGHEDCLNLEVKRPAGQPLNSKLPVLVWIPSYSAGSINPAGLMSRGIINKSPFVFVAPNFRSNVFGELGGKEIAAAGSGNLALRDQRLALEWVQKYISKFGGDPTRVTLIGAGQSAMDISAQLVAFDGQHNNIFKSAILLGAVALPMPAIESGQAVYDQVVKAVGCTPGPGSLECLRKVDYRKLVAALNTFPGIFSQTRYPTPFRSYVDGKFLTSSIEKLVKAGKVARIPIITGAVDDAGTVDTLVEAAHIFDESAVFAWLRRLLPGAKPEELTHLAKLYPSDPSQGSPFNTGSRNAFNAVSKQVAALFGDIAFQGIRRFFSESTQSLMPVYSYIDRGNKFTKYLGSYQGQETVSLLRPPSAGRSNEYQSRVLSFLYTQDPNPKGMKLAVWPKYGSTGEMLEFNDQGVAPRPVIDSFRKQGISYYIQNIMGDGFTRGGTTRM